ncbi:MAG: transposase domain-containing protein [Pseudonocardiales bacterium]|nr:transposase domain-containing protein [Pseudonocardiales bacterium]
MLPSSSALTKARQRLGSKPLELLFDLRRGALAAVGTPGAFAFGLRLVAWDGTGVDAGRYPRQRHRVRRDSRRQSATAVACAHRVRNTRAHRRGLRRCHQGQRATTRPKAAARPAAGDAVVGRPEFPGL